MMKQICATILCLIFITKIFASHIVGGEVYYTYLGQGSAANKSIYNITLRLFTECGQACGGSTAVACPPSLALIGIFNNIFPFNRVQDIILPLTLNPAINLTTYSPCLTSRPPICYRVNTYSAVVELDDTNTGYRLSYQNCCRAGTENVVANASSANNVPGAAYETVIPGTQILPVGHNSNAVVRLKDTTLVCKGSPIALDFGADDPDLDSLSYEFMSAYDGGSFTRNDTAKSADNPLYHTVTYQAGFSGSSPLGPSAFINAQTGLINGLSPDVPGKYVVSVIVREWRNGVNIAEHRKDFLLTVKDCVIPSAKSAPLDKTCDGFTRHFFNNGSNASVQTWWWDFGVADSTSDTSNIPNPTFTYTDTGIYRVTLIVNRGLPCTDSDVTIIKVYPGFFPSLAADPPYCKGVLVHFNDQTISSYGNPTNWHWNFGDNSTTGDTSNHKNPAYTYASAGVYSVKLVVSNTYGCTDSVTSEVTIKESPVLLVMPKDTTYCSLDTVTLTATGTGNFSWSPLSGILNAGTATPVILPGSATKYFVSLTLNGCIARDSVLLHPVNNVTASIAASSTSICQEDTITLTGSSNYMQNVSWLWSPAFSVSDSIAKITKAFPFANTQYDLTVKWGQNCFATTTQPILVKLLAIPEAGPATDICKGQDSAQLQASGGVSYRWTPAAGLSNADIANPIAFPATTTTYKVAIGVAGCSATKTDSITVMVKDLPDAGLTDDTLICSIDTLQLKTTAAANFVWSPNYMISDINSSDPFVSPDVPTVYYTTLTDRFGCINKDSIFVDVKLFVTIDAGKDTTICRTDTFRIRTVSDALSYQWTPSDYLNNDKIKNPVATPLDSFITYHVTGNIGKCQSTDSVTIKTVPYPVITVSEDQHICFGESAALHVRGANRYSWFPVTFLDNPASADPVAVKPARDTRYTVSATGILGCPKPVMASVLVDVRPPVNASTGVKDTSIVIGQSIQFNASGGDQYLWTPSQWLNNINAPNAVAAPESDIVYRLTVTQLPENCSANDSVRIKVYLLPPSFYVPTAFSPNGDGLNDVLKPITLGLKSIRYFRIYNRLGQLVFETTQKDKGWDGSYKGNPQDPAAYVWMAQGETYKGELITRKGNAVLVR